MGEGGATVADSMTTPTKRVSQIGIGNRTLGRADMLLITCICALHVRVCTSSSRWVHFESTTGENPSAGDGVVGFYCDTTLQSGVFGVGATRPRAFPRDTFASSQRLIHSSSTVIHLSPTLDSIEFDRWFTWVQLDSPDS